jgi:2-haloacid dehalogenase
MPESLAQFPLGQIRALVFDVFGTLVDWRRSIAREAQIVLAPLGIAIDWFAFAEAWQRQSQPGREEVRSGRQLYRRLDRLHRGKLDRVRGEFSIEHADEAARRRLNLAWRKIDAWPDVTPGLTALREKFWLAPCANGSIKQMVALARHNGFCWDAIVGAELARDYEPKPAVYLAAAEAFGLAPAQLMMVATH